MRTLDGRTVTLVERGEDLIDEFGNRGVTVVDTDGNQYVVVLSNVDEILAVDNGNYPDGTEDARYEFIEFDYPGFGVINGGYLDSSAHASPQVFVWLQKYFGVQFENGALSIYTTGGSIAPLIDSVGSCQEFDNGSVYVLHVDATDQYQPLFIDDLSEVFDSTLVGYCPCSGGNLVVTDGETFIPLENYTDIYDDGNDHMVWSAVNAFMAYLCGAPLKDPLPRFIVD